MGHAIRAMIVGLLAGLLAWAVMEPSAPKDFFDPDWGRWGPVFAAVVGAFIGGGLAASRELWSGSAARAAIILVPAAILGAILSLAGMALGGRVSEAFFPMALRDPTPSAADIPARMAFATPWAGLLGLVPGLVSLSLVRLRNGLIGGLLGGLFGGVLFDPLSSLVGPFVAAVRNSNEVGIFGRAALAGLIGGGIGLFTGLVEMVTRQAWLRFVLGRNEGREWMLDLRTTVIGRSEFANVPLFGDPQVMPQHAVVERDGGRYVLRDLGSPAGTYVNGQRISATVLSAGDRIQIGKFSLEFHTRAGRAVQVPVAPGPYGYPGSVPPASASQPFPTGYAWPSHEGAGHGVGPAGPTLGPTSGPTAGGFGRAATGTSQAQSQAAVLALMALDGPHAGQTFYLSSPSDLGREAAPLLLQHDARASRRHARVEHTANGWLVLDLGSTNGTFVNGVRVDRAVLRIGDVLCIGSTQLRVESA